jgi:ubiquinone/menaquinone biosynthesis C-methylase UbiE
VCSSPAAGFWCSKAARRSRLSFERFTTIYKRALPFIGEATAGYRPTFEYYWRSVDRFPAGPKFVAELDQAGYTETWYKAQFGGICYLYGAVKPVA